MRDCENVEIRDLLPDHARGALAGAARARVEAHLLGCDTCRDELAVLRAVRAASPLPVVGAADVSRIVAALPRPGDAAGRDQTSSVRSADVVSLDAHRARRVESRGGLPWRRIAAAAAVVVGVAGVGVFADRDRHEPIGSSAATVAPSRGSVDVASPVVPVTTPTNVATADTPRSGGTTRATPRGTGIVRKAAGADALGALGGIASDATDAELEALISGLESLSGIPDLEAGEGVESEGDGGQG